MPRVKRVKNRAGQPHWTGTLVKAEIFLFWLLRNAYAWKAG